MPRYFSTPPIFSVPVTKVDRDNGLIQGITIARVGPAKGHFGFIDRTFLLQIVDNASTKPAGIKARFGHPNMCSSALGTYLGRFKNYSYSGDNVKADLFLDDTAKSTPNGDLFTYVLNMAENNPDMFGASIAFEASDSEIIEEEANGKKTKNEYFRLKELRATDIVDEPAATDGLFSSDSFPAIATQFLDENPDILDLIFTKPDSITEFLSNYITNSKMNLSEKIKQNFSAFLASFAPQSSEQSTPGTQHSQEDNTLNTLFEALCASYPDSFSNVSGFTQFQKAESITAFLDNLTSNNSALTESFEALKSEHQSLITSSQEKDTELETAKSRITELTEQLSARPSIPLNVTDPLLYVGHSTEKDETGKQILASMPKDLKRKLKSTQ